MIVIVIVIVIATIIVRDVTTMCESKVDTKAMFSSRSYRSSLKELLHGFNNNAEL